MKILHVDEALIVLDKPAGLLSVPGRGADKYDSLATRVQAEYPDARTVHRLDMETSGVILMARTHAMLRELSRMFAAREITKEYRAIVQGLPGRDKGTIELPLMADWPNRPRQKVDFDSGKPSVTRYEVLEKYPDQDASLLKLIPVTGRTHQLRLHMASTGHPILGDRLYADEGVVARSPRLMLHACLLGFRHPQTGQAFEVCSTPDFSATFPFVSV